jgi:hypothetical protein
MTHVIVVVILGTALAIAFTAPETIAQTKSGLGSGSRGVAAPSGGSVSRPPSFTTPPQTKSQYYWTTGKGVTPTTSSSVGVVEKKKKKKETVEIDAKDYIKYELETVTVTNKTKPKKTKPTLNEITVTPPSDKASTR